MTVAKVRGTGAARRIHDELPRGRPEERVTLLVERDHPRVRALYESWGYEWFGEVLPFPDAPWHDAMVSELCRRASLAQTRTGSDSPGTCDATTRPRLGRLCGAAAAARRVSTV